MVNVGRPSGGCKTCKTRRIKCDQTQPECTRCKSTGRKCPGVPKESDLMFKNETNAVSARARNAKKKNPVSAETRDSESTSSGALVTAGSPFVDFSSSGSSGGSNVSSPSSFEADNILRMLCGLAPSMEDVALTFLIRNFAKPSARPDHLLTYMNTLPELIQESPTTSSLHKVTTAVALSALGNFPDQRYLKEAAPKHYGEALKQLRDAFNDPIESKSDATLMTVMLMGLYEQMTASESSVMPYKRHLEGAMTLLKHRGQEQFKTTRSLLIFRNIRGALIGMCTALSKPFMDEFEYDPFWLSDEKYDVENVIKQSPSEEKTRALHEVIERANRLDRKFENWFHFTPDEFRWSSVPYLKKSIYEIEPEEEPIYPGMVHRYSDLFIAFIMNNYRANRIYTHRSIMQCLALLNEEHDSIDGSERERNGAALEQSLYVLQRMADDTCASVPYHLGFDDTLELGSPDLKSRDQLSSEASGAYFLIWPLFLVARMEGIPIVQRKWARGRLKFFAELYGFEQARILSNMGPPASREKIKDSEKGQPMRSGDVNAY